MRVGVSLLLLLMILVDCIPSASTSSDLSGYQRVRLRAHRRRHRQKHVDHSEIDELHEMLHEDEQRIGNRRTKNTQPKRERNEELCATERETVELNNDVYEFDPPFMEHVRCRNQAEYDRGATSKVEEQTCVHGMLRCVQRFAERHVTRRARDSASWQPHTLRDVAVGCECMWPVDRYGHIEL